MAVSITEFFPDAPPLGLPGSAGMFGPDTAAWRVGRERYLLAAGPAALLLQVAHPLVAAGVADHSDFSADPLRRLRGTLDAVLTVTFGDGEQARAMAGKVARRHGDVVGRLHGPAGDLPGGTRYRASDPGLALWVLVTLAWSAMAATEAMGRGLPVAERDAYWQDMLRFGGMFGVRRDGAPGTAAELDAYLDEQVAGVLVIDATARRLAAEVLLPRPPILPRGLRHAPTVLAAGLLPPAVRDAYALPWGAVERATWRAARTATRLAVPVLPPALRYWPHYRVARRRLAAGPA